MARTVFLPCNIFKSTICFLLLTIPTRFAEAARNLDEVDPQLPLAVIAPEASDPTTIDDPDVAPVVAPATSLLSGQMPATGATTLPNGQGPVISPGVTVAPVANVPNSVTPPIADVGPLANPAVTSPSGAVPIATVGPEPSLSFFMHDILGGTHPSGRVVTGIAATSNINNLPFSRPNNKVFPINGGVPINGININGIINSNNAPFLVGLNGQPRNNIIQNNGNNNIVNGGNNLPFVNPGQLPSGLTLQRLMFGSMTVVDNELTEGQELGADVLGKAQGFYLASSLDGSSHTLVLTVLLHAAQQDVDDTISFFGVHRTATQDSHIVVVGGTGKYENAKGYAVVETLHHPDQHITDGMETITQFSVYLTL